MANTKITTGADATIVAAATRAGLAAAPPDYSDAFENVSRSYAETIKTSSKMWDQIFQATAVVGGELIKNAADWNSSVQKIYDAGGSENIVNEIYALKDELRGLGPLSGIFGNRETRKKRMEILTKKNQLFSEIDQWGEVINNAAIAIENNNLDYNLMGLDKQSTLNAIIASNTNNKITATNEYAKITKNEQGSLSYTVYNEDGSEATYSDGSPKTMDLSEFKSLISQNVADKENVYSNAMNELSTSAENLGATHGGEYNKYFSSKMRNALNSMTNTANDRRRLMRTAFGIDNKSIYEDITGAKGLSELSVDMWSLMMENLAAGEIKGELAVTTGQRGELLTNIKDTDNSGGISQKEINKQWMAFTGSLLSGESDLSKQVIIDYADKQFKLNFDFGARQKAIGQNAGKKGGKDSLNPFKPGSGERVDMGDGKTRYIPSSVQNRRRRNVIDIVENDKDGAIFSGELGNYTWISDEGRWKSGENLYTTFEIMNDERIYAADQSFEQGLRGVDGVENKGQQFGKLTEQEVTRIDNIWEDVQEESRAANAVNKILKKYGSPKSVTVPWAPGSNYKIEFDGQEFYTDNPKDLQDFKNLIERELSKIKKTKTSTSTTSINEEDI